MTSAPLPSDLHQALREYRLGDPFLLLGPQQHDQHFSLRAWRPESTECWIGDEEGPLLAMQHQGQGLYEWIGRADALPQPYRLHWRDVHGQWRDSLDPYAFREPLVADFDLHLYSQGKHWHIHEWLGSHPLTIDGVAGVRFAVWAPHAERVSVVGDFNGWDGRLHLMRGHGSGVWSLFVPELAAGALYKYEIRAANGSILLKADPYARRCQLRPETASQVAGISEHAWTDEAWLLKRSEREHAREPLSIYEVHLGSWQRGTDGTSHGSFLNYREIAHRLVPYARELGFTHLELLPISEHPFDGSWGYQTIGLYSPTSRHGTPDDFRYFIDHCHANGLGVILDWVPAHFPKDAHGLARFDGQPLYEYPDPQRGEHPEWGTLIYDYGRPQVRNFLLANALYWIEHFHIDGLRVDAVASMLYLDYERDPGQWQPNKFGGREHLEAMDFLRDLNIVVHGQHPDAMVIAEESTAWPGVSRPVDGGGLGFTMKWDLGWMHDSLDYFKQDPLYRRHQVKKLTFGFMYAWSENFVLPLSHDEVVHLKKSLLEKMPGDDWQKFANLRLLLGWQWTRPGKKLLFMGGEFGQRREWNHDRELDWWLDVQPLHAGLRRWVADLNQVYRDVPALFERDFDIDGFEWLDFENDESVFVYRRRDAADGEAVIILNATPVPRYDYRVGVPRSGEWIERLNSDAAIYGGSDVGNAGSVRAFEQGWKNQPCSLSLVLPPLGLLLLVPAAVELAALDPSNLAD